MTTPVWQAAENGIPGRLASTNQSAQVNQLLAAHQVMPIYQGTQILTPNGGTQFDPALAYGNSHDLDQPFVLSGTTVGRVVVPVMPFGSGADMLVSLCPDNGSGSPLTSSPLAATSVPAAAITQLAATEGLENATGPLMTPANNTAYCTGSISSTPWAGPTGDVSGIAYTAAMCTSGNYFIYLGGDTTTAVAGVNTAQYVGGGEMALPVAQPPLPQASFYGSATTTSSAVIYMGGNNSAGPLTAVWVASWDPSTGLIGSWSGQAPLPLATQNGGAATWNNSTVYYIGGSIASGACVTTVYWTTISNGQLGAWSVGPSLPTPTSTPFVGVFGNWLVVAGGNTGSATATGATYFAPINATTGALGAWQTGPTMSTPTWAYAAGWDTASTDNALIVLGGQGAIDTTAQIQILSVGPTGPSPAWQSSTWNESYGVQIGAFATGAGNWDIVQTSIQFSEVSTTHLCPAPYLSVPLYATGLTSGSTYHVVLQQHQNAAASDYLAFCVLDDQPLPLNALKSARHSGTWATVETGWCVPMSVYSASASGPAWHTWEDPNAYNTAQRTSTLLYNDYQLPIGVVEQTLKANPPRNANSTFAAGVIPWTASGGAFTQSSAQTHGGFVFSGLLTPSGSAASAIAQSELFPVSQGGGPFYGSASWYLVDGWLYSPPGYANVSLSVAWYDQGSNPISTSSTVQALTAATWTHVQNWVLAPAGTAFGQIQATESGTPASSALLYLSDVVLIASQECVGSLTSAAAIEYPASVPWPPVGVQQLL